MKVPAPVLVPARILEPEFCRGLIDVYETHGGGESGFMRDAGGMTVGLLDPGHKRRKGHDIAHEEVRIALRARLNRRLVPEIHDAVQFSATRIERYIFAC